MIMVLSELQCKKICELIRKCGTDLLDAHNGDDGSDSIMSKSGTANFVTEYDVKTQRSLMAGLEVLFPGAVFYAEEKDNSDVDKNRSVCFFIDPIDGTTNFIHDMRMSALSVALYSYGEPVFGAVYNPYSDEMFWAKNGSGAYLNDKRISVSDSEMNTAIVLFGTAPYDRTELAAGFFPILYRVFMNCADIRRSGSAALDVCYVAAGRADAYFEPLISPWDYAAGKIILEEAGGKMTSFSGDPVLPGAKTSV